jgi:hypothetical protein
MSTNPSGGRKGIRKDAISHGLYAFVFEKYGTLKDYFIHLDKVMPGKPADMLAKYIPQEIAQTLQVTHNVLICNFPEPRAINTSEPVQLDVIDVDAGVKPTGCAPVTADAGVSAPDEECEDG